MWHSDKTTKQQQAQKTTHIVCMWVEKYDKSLLELKSEWEGKIISDEAAAAAAANIFQRRNIFLQQRECEWVRREKSTQAATSYIYRRVTTKMCHIIYWLWREADKRKQIFLWFPRAPLACSLCVRNEKIYKTFPPAALLGQKIGDFKNRFSQLYQPRAHAEFLHSERQQEKSENSLLCVVIRASNDRLLFRSLWKACPSVRVDKQKFYDDTLTLVCLKKKNVEKNFIYPLHVASAALVFLKLDW